MTRTRSKGIALLLVISIMGMMAMSFAHIARSCMQLSVQTSQLYASNLEMNLIASALAWAILKGHTEKATRLDATEIASSGPVLDLYLEEDQGHGIVRVSTRIEMAGQVLTSTRTYRLPSP